MEREQNHEELVTLIEVNQLATAIILQATLEEAGIQVFLQNELMSQLYCSCIGGVVIQVPYEDAEKARNLLIENGYNL